MGLFDAAAAATPAAPVVRTAGTRAAPSLRWRSLIALSVLLLCFAAVAAQLLRLALKGGPRARIASAEAPISAWARPDIVDRHGRLMAADRAVKSLFADPQVILDLDEAVERVSAVLPALNAGELRKALADKGRRFVWVARGLQPEEAQAVHELGLPGLGFRTELKRYYPLGP